MAQRTYLDLVNVEFSDMTNNEVTPIELDTMGVVMPYPWGPVDKPLVLDKASFFAQYPEALPGSMGPRSNYEVYNPDKQDKVVAPIFDTVNTHYFDAYMQCKQFFANGGRAVEIVCPQENKKYVGGFTDDGVGFASLDGADPHSGRKYGKYFIGLVYPGLPTTGNLGMKYRSLAIRITTPSATSDRCKIELVGYHEVMNVLAVGDNPEYNDSGVVIESFQGQWYDEQKQVSGSYTHFTKVLKNSRFLRCYNTEDEEFRAIAGKYTIDSYPGIFSGNVLEGTEGSGQVWVELYCEVFQQYDPTPIAGRANPYIPVLHGPVAETLYQNPCKIGDIINKAEKSDLVAEGTTGQAAVATIGDTDILADPYLRNYRKYFGNIDKTRATILIAPIAAAMREENELLDSDNPGGSNLSRALEIYINILSTQVSEYCMTRMSFLPCNGKQGPGAYSYEEMVAKLALDPNEMLPKFTNLIDGCEQTTFMGVKFVLDCCGGVAGAYTTIARNVRVNQVASARTYGAYRGVLLKDPEFDDVLDNHESGIVTLYNGASGPEIFGVHCAAYLEDPQSYYATNNVSRVITWLLRDLFPRILGAIHTDSVANRTSRAILNDACSDIVDNYIAKGNLLEDSYFDIPEVANGEPHNRKGRLLTCILACHFIGLVERVDFKIVATDSTVTVELA